MAEIINLNKARKAKVKTEARKQAADNRVIFGTSSKLRQAQKAKSDLMAKRHEGHRLTPPDASSKPESETPDSETLDKG